MNTRAILLAGLVFTLCQAHGQWELDGRLVLDGDSAADRRVTGVAGASAPQDGTTPADHRAQLLVEAEAQGLDQLNVTLDPAPGAYVPGLGLAFVPQAANTGPVTLDVNGLGPRDVLGMGSQPLDSANLRPGMPVHVVYDGAAFQVVNAMDPACPTGYLPVSTSVCIQAQPNGPLNVYAAAGFCTQRGARLCSFGEWAAGCAMAGGFLPSVSDFEWVDHAANDANKVKRMGWDAVLQEASCTQGGLALPSTATPFRCCYER